MRRHFSEALPPRRGDDYTPGRYVRYEVFDANDSSRTTNALCATYRPRDGRMAFVRSPDNISIELLQMGDALEPAEPWTSMENIGHW